MALRDDGHDPGRRRPARRRLSASTSYRSPTDVGLSARLSNRPPSPIRGGASRSPPMALVPRKRMGTPPGASPPMRMTASWFGSQRTHRIQGCGAMYRARWQAPPRKGHSRTVPAFNRPRRARARTVECGTERFWLDTLHPHTRGAIARIPQRPHLALRWAKGGDRLNLSLSCRCDRGQGPQGARPLPARLSKVSGARVAWRAGECSRPASRRAGHRDKRPERKSGLSGRFS